MTSDLFPAYYSDRMRQYISVNEKNRIMTAALAKVLDGPAALRKFILRNVIAETYTMEDVLNNEEIGQDFVRRSATGVWHATSTCKMGAPDDPMAVDGPNRPRARRSGLARCRCLDLPVRALRQHQLPDHDGGREDLPDAIIQGNTA